LIDIRDPEDTYSAGAFARDAATAIREINARDRLALIVGGTLLYLRALRDGLTDLPIRNESVRAVIELEAEARGWPAMHAELAKIDPLAAARIEPTDRQRIQRGLEVFRVSGESLSAIQSRGGRKGMSDIATVALVPADRQALKEAIAMRFDAMTAAGLVDEVASLRRRPDLSADTPSMRSVGYRQVWAHLAGQCDWAAARERAIVATRQLAKRQMTWLRSDSFSSRIDTADSGKVEVLKDVIRRQIDR
jgi:tRNA dimethylallyltransferase